MDPNDPSNPGASLDQAAIDSALQTYNDAAARMRSAAQQYDRAVAGNSASDETAASAQLDNARTQLAQASRDYGNLLQRVSAERSANGRAAKDPNEQRLWVAEADKADAQSKLYLAEADMYSAKTQADIDKASATAQAALQNAKSRAGTVQSTNDRNSADALLAGAKAASIPALTASTIALHDQAIQTGAARATQSIANANKAQAQTDILIPAQAQRLLAQAGYSQAQIDKLQITTPLTAAELAAKTNLDVTKVKQIAANISKQQVLPYSDTNAPNLDVFQPSTGQVTGVQNPAYKNPYMQPLADRAAAIDAIKNDLAAGKFGTGQQSIDYANNLIAGISEAAQLQAQGYTPEQYQQAINNQANIGSGILDKMASTGSSAASTLLNYASKARGLGGFQATPYQNAIGMFGGNDMVQKALSLISQIKPITDRNGAADAIARYGAASALMKANGGGQQPDQSQPAAQPDQSQDNGPAGFSGYGTPGGYQGGPNPNTFGSAPGGFDSGTQDQSGMRQLFLSGALGGAQ